jgi:hypothetical protein
MTNTTRNVLLALAVVIFAGVAMRDFTRHDTHGALGDLFLGTMICVLVLRVSKMPRRPASPE